MAAQEAGTLSEQGGPPVAADRINALGILYGQWGRALADTGDMPAAIDSGDGQLSIGLVAELTVTYRRAIQTINEGLATAAPVAGVAWAGLAEALDKNLATGPGRPRRCLGGSPGVDCRVAGADSGGSEQSQSEVGVGGEQE